MSRPMNLKEFAELFNKVLNDHSPLSPKPGCSPVKYIDPVFDMRTNTVFSIRFRMFGAKDITLHCQNECRDLKESLFERCVAALQRKD